MNPTYQDFLAGFKPGAKPEADLLRDFRLKTYGKFQQVGLPTRKTEAWKYMNLDPVLKASFQQKEFSSKLSSGKLPAGVRFENIPAMSFPMTDKDGLSEEENAFALVNDFSFEEGTCLFVPRNTAVEGPLAISLKAGEVKSSIFYPRILIMLEEGAQAQVILDYADTAPEFYLMNSVVQIQLARNSKLSLLNLQHGNEKAVHLSAHRIRLSEGSQFEGISVTTGGAQVRNDIRADFLEGNASFSQDGLAVLGGNSQVFQHLAVHHRTPHNTSRQYFKNILSGTAQAEFTSLVHVWRGAVKSDAGQLDRNLLLSDAARVWSRPQLKIDADDVKANHGAATGQLQETELFYLQSRGLDKNSAKFILACGFAEELLNKIQPEGLREKVKAPLRERIRKMVMTEKET